MFKNMFSGKFLSLITIPTSILLYLSIQANYCAISELYGDIY